MIPKEKAEVKLNCFYAAKNLMGVDGGVSISSEAKPTTEAVLEEAKKIWKWVSEASKEDDE